jgi:hypothetical protein
MSAINIIGFKEYKKNKVNGEFIAISFLFSLMSTSVA